MTTTVDTVTAPATPRAEGLRRALGRWRHEEKAALVALGVLVVLVLVAVFAPLIAPHDPNAQSIADRLATPSGTHPLGTDDLGRDVLSRLLYGARASLVASVLAMAVAVLVGLPLGLAAGFAGGIVDIFLRRVLDTVLAFPAIVLAIGVTGVVGPGLVTSMCAIGIVFAPSVARLIRGQTLSTRERLYVPAAVTYGSHPLRVAVRHVLPNAVAPVVIQMSLLMSTALLAEASLSFLGLGVQPPTASWGSMLGQAYGYMSQAPTQVFAPGIAIVLTAYCFIAVGDALRRELDPRQQTF
ncbi:ABC transporter permease [Pseudonocardia sp. NPDC049154]|uniref:ABC transporter permease n=1 Tax=Pseudonocardia sp. NPDC049154 TaxID=3155501 RepID=UPI0033EDBFA9